MTCYQLCSPIPCTYSCDCVDTYPSACCIQPMVYRYCSPKCQSPKSQGNISTNDNTLTNQNGNESEEKFSIHVNVAGFNQESLETKIENGKLILEANKEERLNDEEYTVQQFRRTYLLPKQVDTSRITSRMISNNMFLIEAPFVKSSANENRFTQGDLNTQNGVLTQRENNNQNKDLTQSEQTHESLASYIKLLMNADFHPCIIDQGNNKKALQMTIDVKNCKLEETDILIKNNELVIEGECKHKENHHSKRARFYRATTLPKGAQIDQMTKQLDQDGQLKIQIPFSMK
ncbi:hypothetical protein I4U23_005399 [Adineta vaga]|nr:hypothetical protein I4U23_005399 [Adineta vaga]